MIYSTFIKLNGKIIQITENNLKIEKEELKKRKAIPYNEIIKSGVKIKENTIIMTPKELYKCLTNTQQ